MSPKDPQTPTPEKASKSEDKLETTVERLEAIVEELESGDADLERSITLFQEGRKLGAQALKKLESLERRVQIVVRTEDEKLHLEDFDRNES